MLLTVGVNTQAYEYHLACGDVSTEPQDTHPALLLSGGADAGSVAEKAVTQWFLSKADQGDYLVLRSGGIGRQADWICKNFADQIRSAAELSIDSLEDSNFEALLNTIRHAEVIYIAGGDQNRYEDFWKNTPLADALNQHMLTKPIGGSSAGMAILGGSYYAPSRKRAVLGSQLLNNPYHPASQDFFHGDLLHHPWLNNTYAETHLNRRLRGEQRYSRLFGFLARSVGDLGLTQPRFAIGLEEATFLTVNKHGQGKVYGNNAYFLQTQQALPEQVQANKPLIWDRKEQAVKVYRIQGSPVGYGHVDLKNWQQFSGGEWQYWFTTKGNKGFNCQKGC